MADLTIHPAYVLNLRWDVLAWNPAAELVVGFSRMQPGMRNFLWMVFMDPAMRTVLSPWKEQAQNVISLFRRDYVKARQEADFSALVKSLEDADPDFRTWMSEHDVSGISAAFCHFDISNIGCVPFQCTALTINENQHLRLICYVAEENNKNGQQFEKEILSSREK